MAIFSGVDAVASGQGMMSAREYCRPIRRFQDRDRWIEGYFEEFANAPHHVRGIADQIAVMNLVDEGAHAQQLFDLLA